MTQLDETLVVAVVGAGAMGAGIAQVAATAGHRVLLFDAREGAAAQGAAGIARALDKLAAHGRLAAEDAAAAAARVEPVAALADLAGAGLVIEAIVEDAEIKRRLFAQLEAIVPADAILATNTSSLSVTALAQGLAQPARVAGFHFFNPAPAMKLVELVSGLATDAGVIDMLEALSLAWGKHPVRTRSTPGFIVNRVARPFYGEAWRLIEEGVADPATIDAVLRDSGGFRMGPFELMDMIGHDVNFAVTQSVFAACFGDPRYRPAIAQGELVAAGWLGRKSGRGIYDHAGAAPVAAWLPPSPAPSEVRIEGDLGPTEPLVAAIERAGIAVSRVAGDGVVRIGDIALVLADGRTATERAAAGTLRDIVQFDLAFDFERCAGIAIAAADHAAPAAIAAAAGLFQAIGKQVAQVADGPGLIVFRTVAMIANEAAEIVQQRIASAEDVDRAMTLGVNYPIGPIAWTARIGAVRTLGMLDALHRATGDDRYRASLAMRRQAIDIA